MEQKKEMTEEEAAAGIGALFGDEPSVKELAAEYSNRPKKWLVDELATTKTDYAIVARARDNYKESLEKLKAEAAHLRDDVSNLVNTKMRLERQNAVLEKDLHTNRFDLNRVREFRDDLQRRYDTLLEVSKSRETEHAKAQGKLCQQLERAYDLIHDLTEP